MSTYVNYYIEQLDLQWSEVSILINEANAVKETNVPLYDAICRSVSVLIVAHLEGFIKGLAKNIVSDLNQNHPFKELPESVKRTYCKKFIGYESKLINNYSGKLNDLIDVFGASNDIKITEDAFLFDDNKNQKPDIIKNVLEKFGVDDIFKNLHGSIFDQAFISVSKLNRVLKLTKTIVKGRTAEYPYTIKIKKFKCNSKKYKVGRTLWQSYLDEINQLRHKIAHGNSFNNYTDIRALDESKLKAQLLQLAIILVVCGTFSKK